MPRKFNANWQESKGIKIFCNCVRLYHIIAHQIASYKGIYNFVGHNLRGQGRGGEGHLKDLSIIILTYVYSINLHEPAGSRVTAWYAPKSHIRADHDYQDSRGHLWNIPRILFTTPTTYQTEEGADTFVY